MSPSQMPNSKRRCRAFGDNLMTHLCILSQRDHFSRLLKVRRALIESNSEDSQSAQKNSKVKLIVLAMKAEEKIIELEKAFVQRVLRFCEERMMEYDGEKIGLQ